MKVNYRYPQYRSLSDFNRFNSAASMNKTSLASKFTALKTASTLSMNSIDSCVLCGTVIQRPESTQTKNADCSQFHRDSMHWYPRKDCNIIQCVTWTQIVTIDSDSNEPTRPYGFGRELSIVPPNLNNLNLPPNPFNLLATMFVVNPTEDGSDEDYCPQSPEPSDPSPISTPRWTSAQLRDARRFTRRRIITHSALMMNTEEFSFCHQLLPHRLHPTSWKGNWAL